MWSFQSPRAVYSPEDSRENVTSNHQRSSSHQFTDSTTLPSSPVPEYEHPAEIESVTPVATTPRYSKQEPWHESASGSTLTHDKEPLEVYDVEHEEKQSSAAPAPVPFWSTTLKATRNYVFVRYAWTCKFECAVHILLLTLQCLFFASSSLASCRYTGAYCSASRRTSTVRPSPLSILTDQ